MCGHIIKYEFVDFCMSCFIFKENRFYDFRGKSPASTSMLSGLSERSEKILEEW